jgi:hypothetical protein
MNILPNRFDYVFFVYPGTRSDMDGYMPRWMTKYSCLRTKIFIGGVVTIPKNKEIGRGLIVGAPSAVRSLIASQQECAILHKKTLRLAEKLSAKAIAIAGRGPSIFLHHNIPMTLPFVRGEKGMIFCTIMALQAAITKHDIVLENANVVIFGAGRVGKSIQEFFCMHNCDAKNICAQSIFDTKKRALKDDMLELLHNADIIVVISAKGSDMYPYMKYLKDGAIIIDDTHPRMKRPFKRGFLYRASLSMSGLRFLPSLQAYTGKSVPGCVIEAIVYAKYEQNIADQIVFNELAKKIGLQVEGITT